MTTINHIDAAILEMAQDFRGTLVPAEVADKITLRILGERPPLALLTGAEIRALRDDAHMSQAVFAGLLGLTTGYLSQLERGARQATGATLALLHVVRRYGVTPLLDAPAPLEA
jgi:putative transcriptional regulator